MAKITSAQMKKIYAVAKEYNIETIQGSKHDQLHDIVYEVTRQRSISELTKEQAISVIDRITGAKVIGVERATARQVGYIRDLAKQLGWHNNPKRLEGFIRKYTKIEKLEWISVRDASNIIEGLKRQVGAMKGMENGNKKENV